MAVDAKTGRPVRDFRVNGKVDLMAGSPRAIRGQRDYQNALTYSVQSPPIVVGDVVITTAPDFYGGHRPGDNRHAESLLCLEARTGRQAWSFQTVHHGLWDYDNPAAPNLIDLTIDGATVKAVAQVTKQSFVYTFNRVTGQPIWPIEERPVPVSDVPGERASWCRPDPATASATCRRCAL